MKIVTNYWRKPIPTNRFDWSAIDADTYDVDCDEDGFFSNHPRGYGRTEAEAIADLKQQIADRDNDMAREG